MKRYKFISTFMESFQNEVHEAINILTKLFEENDIDFIIVGGVSTFIHGYNRATEDIDIIVNSSDKHKIENLPISYVKELSKGSFRKFKIHDVKSLYLEIIYSGDSFGDKKVPELNHFTRESKHLISLKGLIVMKLEAGRRQDLLDVVKLIEKNKLSKNYLQNEKYLELWREVSE